MEIEKLLKQYQELEEQHKLFKDDIKILEKLYTVSKQLIGEYEEQTAELFSRAENCFCNITDKG